MKNVQLNFNGPKNFKYPLRLGLGVLKTIPEFIKQLKPAGNCCILYDANVAHIVTPLQTSLQAPAIAIPSGEHDKSLEQVKRIYEDLAFKHIQQNDVLIVIGGGRTLDLGGFVAHTYRSGLRAIYVPTNLLALTDSCIGGKAYINIQKAKNLIGVEHHPIAIVGDIQCIQQSPTALIEAGLVEIIKLAIMADKELFGWLEENIDRILAKETVVLRTLIERAIDLRYDSVTHARNHTHILNTSRFGHVIGHALESLSNFSISHTQAVSIGMCTELRIIKHPELKRCVAFLKRINQPTNIPLAIRTNQIWELVRNEHTKTAEIIVPAELGSNQIVTMTFEQLAQARD